MKKLKIIVWILRKFLFMFTPVIFFYLLFSVGSFDFNPTHWHSDAVMVLVVIIPLAPLVMIAFLASSYQLDEFFDDFPNKK